MSVAKSLLSCRHRLGCLAFDVGRALKLPALKNRLAERILTEAEVHRMLALETAPRNHALLRLLFGGGLRGSEACSLAWRHVQPRGEGGQVTVYGKGGKTRVVLLSVPIWQDVAGLGNGAGPEDPVFRSRKGGPLDPSQVDRIVRAAARRAGIAGKASPHWLRHAHASHALDRGSRIHVVQATLGHASVATTGRYLHARPSASSAKYFAV